jgi:hypothetical protein
VTKGHSCLEIMFYFVTSITINLSEITTVANLWNIPIRIPRLGWSGRHETSSKVRNITFHYILPDVPRKFQPV